MVLKKRIYDAPGKNDGFRVLVDRLWPRSLNRDKARVDLWLKDIAPSHELRKWFAHDPAKWPEFKKRYKDELKDRQELIKIIREETKKGKVTLLFAAKDAEHNNAVVLKELLEE